LPSAAAIHVAQSLQRGLNSLFGFVPNLIGFLVILVVGYPIARVVKTVVAKLLEKVGVDRALHGSQAGQYVERVSPGAHPSRLIGAIAFWFIFIYALAAAIGALKIPALTNFMANVQNYLPNVVAAVLIFVAGAALAGVVGGLAQKLMGDTPTGRVARAVGPGLILAIVVFMVLNQLRIAPAIVETTYVALIGMLALAGALAFGLGGRDVAADMLHNAYGSAQDHRDGVKRDLQAGRDRVQEQTNRLRTEARGANSQSTPGARPRV